MHLRENLSSSLRNIFEHKLRSALTLLGIVIGVFAVITMFSAVNGIKSMVMKNMEQLGWNNSLLLYPGEDGNSTSTVSSRHRRFMYINRSRKPLSFEDYQALSQNVQTKYSYGMIQRWERTTSNKQSKSDWLRINATNNDFFHSKSYDLKKGRYFNKMEDSDALKVCILGYNFAEKNFPDGGIGEIVKAGNMRYQVIGILDKDQLVSTGGMNFNRWERQRDLNAVYIPLSTAAKYLTADHAIDYIYFQAFGDHDFPLMKNQIRQRMLVQHNMSHDFQFNDVGAFMFKITDELKDMMKKLNITLSTIASISLIVGGIGLFSTLLISISERMKEIGIRKSIGATELDVFSLFLSESIILAVIAASIGTLLSKVVIMVVSSALNQHFELPWQGIALGFGFSILIGILSGAYPAFKASRINPITAIYFND
jgi:ABC-type antimicrobial peptide transport system permease subunit